MASSDIFALGLRLTPSWRVVDQRLETDRQPHELRRIAAALAYLLPALLALLAALCASAGLLVERWLFFAEATRIATIYYGR